MKATIEKFIKDKDVAVVGASRDPRKWGSGLAKMLTKKGYTVHPVNPQAKKIEGLTCYATVGNLPKNVSNIIISLPAAKAVQVLKECSGSGVKRVWLHKGVGGEGASSPEAVEAARQAGLEVVYGLCPMMFYPPTGIHRIHFLFRKWRKKLPPEFSA
jgi:hypothetical protein